MNQQLSDEFYILNRFRDALTRATAGCESAGLVLDVPATVRRMAAKHSGLLRVEDSPATLCTLVVRCGPEAHFHVTPQPSGLPIIYLVRETSPA